MSTPEKNPLKRQLEDVEPPLESTPPKRPKPELNEPPSPNPNENQNTRLTRTQFFLAICELLRQKSNDPYFKVGCCLVRSDTRQLQSIGYNGFLVGENNDPEIWKAKALKQAAAGQKNPDEVREDYLQHAETNAIHFCTESDLVDTIAYVSCLPCSNCCAKLIQKRVPAVVYNITQKKYIQPSLKAFDLANIYVMSYNDIEPQDGQQVCIKLEGYENSNKDWEVLFMAIAVLASQRCEANVPKKEGCVVVRDKQILGYGYSGYPQLMMKKRKSVDGFPTISAVQNALCFTTNVTGATVYCTHFPNREAMKELIQRGVSVVKYLNGVDPRISNPSFDKLSKAELTDREDYLKVIKLAVKNPISLRVFGKGASRVDTDTSDTLNASMDVPNVVTRFTDLKVKVIPVQQAQNDYMNDSAKKEDIHIVLPDESAQSHAKDDMDEWFNSPDSIRIVKQKREQKEELNAAIELNTPIKAKK